MSKRSADTEGLETLPSKKPRLPKRKVALQIGYCGTGYHGMQLNNPHKTIEGDLFQALVKAGAISEDNADDPKKSSFLRAARTDKGVHAAGNVVSLKMIVEDPEIVNIINSHLPEQIRVWGFTRTNRAFECRKMCSSRVYEYVLPTYCLMNPGPLTKLGEVMRQKTNRLAEGELATECKNFWDEILKELESQGVTYDVLKSLKESHDRDLKEAKNAEKETKENGTETETKENETKETTETETKETTETTETKTTETKPESNQPEDESSLPSEIKIMKQVENASRRSYRANPARIEALSNCLQRYVGVHNFHNFTVGKPYKDPSAMRVMHSLKVSEPFVINNTEWVSVKIHGQSFMLHQIRKMIALAVLAVRTNTDPAKIDHLFTSDRVSIPKAPALGLLLERPMYDAYNNRLGKLGHESISFDKYDKDIDAFKNKFIYDKIYAKEKEENEFQAFFGYMDTYRLNGLLDFLLDIKPEESGAGADTKAEPEPEIESGSEEYLGDE
ncbi:pseudouridine synthase [Starmerella bacillaris]|uniref:tRNA pseudouridine synthase 1 n=1 Tax=Starmerella bacillaris TaxID=1247836 RepID=A0AAV5RM29_STABA|nr:pseudouridine synthase [Starmerella bacillaris]